MWANEGECTVESLMRSGTKDLAAAMSCGDATELGVTKKAMHELLNGLARLHACGVVQGRETGKLDRRGEGAFLFILVRAISLTATACLCIVLFTGWRGAEAHRPRRRRAVPR